MIKIIGVLTLAKCDGPDGKYRKVGNNKARIILNGPTDVTVKGKNICIDKILVLSDQAKFNRLSSKISLTNKGERLPKCFLN